MKKLFTTLFFFAIPLLYPASVFAAINCSSHPACGDQVCPATFACLTNTILPGILDAAFAVIGSVVVILIVLSGYKFIMSRGDPKQLDAARKTLFYALLGLGVVVGAGFILNVIASATGIRCLAFGHGGVGFGFTNCR